MDLNLNKTDYYNGNPNIKKAGIPYNYSEAEIEEYYKCSQDPIYFIKKYVKIISLDDGLVAFDMRDYQERMVEAYHENRFCVTLTSRQTGKCHIESTCINICKIRKSGFKYLIHKIYNKLTNESITC